MAHWLYKSEPATWSWDDQVAAGARARTGTACATIRRKLNLMAMKKGDRGFFYHSDEGKEIVGIVEVIREAYPDPTDRRGPPWVVVDIKAVKPLPKPVTLD